MKQKNYETHFMEEANIYIYIYIYINISSIIKRIRGFEAINPSNQETIYSRMIFQP